MAQIYGTSGAWQEISDRLEAMQLKAGHPREVETLLESCMQEYEKLLRIELDASEDEIVLMEQEIAQEKTRIQAEIAAYTEKFSLDIEQTEATLDFYRHDRSIFNIFRKSFRIRSETKKLDALRKNMQDYRNEIEQPLHVKEARLEQKKASKDRLAREHCNEIGTKIDFLKAISGSQELANAQAELEMLEYLKNLPADVRVINQIRLKVDRGFKIQGKWLIQSQIDQMVISPAGLFAIEVKNWSKQNTEKRQKESSSEQIKDAAQLCHLLLKPDFPEITVRPILAYRGHIPGNENTGFVKVLPIQEVCGYINWFQETTLSEKSLQEIVIRLQDFSNQESRE